MGYRAGSSLTEKSGAKRDREIRAGHDAISTPRCPFNWPCSEFSSTEYPLNGALLAAAFYGLFNDGVIVWRLRFSLLGCDRLQRHRCQLFMIIFKREGDRPQVVILAPWPLLILSNSSEGTRPPARNYFGLLFVDFI